MIDLARLGYAEWLSFTFDHPVVNSFEDVWHFKDENEYTCSNSSLLIDYLTTLFNEPIAALKKYSFSQIEQGFWFIPSCNGYLWCWLDKNVACHRRVACVKAVDNLYLQYFNSTPRSTTAVMWWDSVLSYTVLGDDTFVEDNDIFFAIVNGIANCLHSKSPIAKMAGKEGASRLLAILKKIGDERMACVIQKLQWNNSTN